MRNTSIVFMLCFCFGVSVSKAQTFGKPLVNSVVTANSGKIGYEVELEKRDNHADSAAEAYRRYERLIRYVNDDDSITYVGGGKKLYLNKAGKQMRVGNLIVESLNIAFKQTEEAFHKNINALYLDVIERGFNHGIFNEYLQSAEKYYNNIKVLSPLIEVFPNRIQSRRDKKIPDIFSEEIKDLHIIKDWLNGHSNPDNLLFSNEKIFSVFAIAVVPDYLCDKSDEIRRTHVISVKCDNSYDSYIGLYLKLLKNNIITKPSSFDYNLDLYRLATNKSLGLTYKNSYSNFYKTIAQRYPDDFEICYRLAVFYYKNNTRSSMKKYAKMCKKMNIDMWRKTPLAGILK